jgi:hypothetical protein
MLEQNDEWTASCRHMTLEMLGSVSHNPIVSPSALAVRTEPDPAVDRWFPRHPAGHGQCISFMKKPIKWT